MRSKVRSFNIPRSVPREVIDGPLPGFADVLFEIQSSIISEGSWGDFPVLTADEYEKFLSDPHTAYDVAGWILHSPWSNRSDLWGGWNNRPIDYQTWKYVRMRLLSIRADCTERGLKGRYTSDPPEDYDAYKVVGKVHELTEKVKLAMDDVCHRYSNLSFTYEVGRRFTHPTIYFIDPGIHNPSWMHDPGVFAHLSFVEHPVDTFSRERTCLAYFRTGPKNNPEYRWNLNVGSQCSLEQAIDMAVKEAQKMLGTVPKPVDRPRKETPKASVPKKTTPRKPVARAEPPKKAAKPMLYEVRLDGKMKAQFESLPKAQKYLKELKKQGLSPGIVRLG